MGRHYEHTGNAVIPHGFQIRPNLHKRKLRMMRASKRPACHYCGARLNANTATLDHVVPMSKGGKHSRGNLVLACRPCNQEKADGPEDP